MSHKEKCFHLEHSPFVEQKFDFPLFLERVLKKILNNSLKPVLHV